MEAVVAARPSGERWSGLVLKRIPENFPKSGDSY